MASLSTNNWPMPTPRLEKSSTTKTQFSDKKADDIIRVSAFHRTSRDFAVLWSVPHDWSGIRESISPVSQKNAQLDLGALDILPEELLDLIVPQLDVLSLFRFRQVNRKARQFVDAVKEYKLITTHGLNAYGALLRTKLGAHVTLFEFDQAMRSRDCTVCSEFGGFMFLPTWTRCCFDCLQKEPNFRMQTVTGLLDELRPLQIAVPGLRSFVTLPGQYSIGNFTFMHRVRIACISQAISNARPAAAYALHPSKPPLLVGNFTCNPRFSFMAACALPYVHPDKDLVDPGISCAGCQMALEKMLAVARVAEIKKVRSRDDFLEHFASCKHAQFLWKSSSYGKIEPLETPTAAKVEKQKELGRGRRLGCSNPWC